MRQHKALAIARIATMRFLFISAAVLPAASQGFAAATPGDIPRSAMPPMPVALAEPREEPIVIPAKFTFIGVKRAQDCGPALSAIQQELLSLEYPAGWTFKIACTGLLWERVQRKSDHPNAPFAISDLKHHVTFFNAAMFREAHHVYRRAMSHELEHI